MVAEPEVVVSSVALEVSEPGVVFVADVAEPQASVDIAVAFDFLVPVSVVLVEVDSSGKTIGIVKNEWTRYGAEGFLVRAIERKGPL